MRLRFSSLDGLRGLAIIAVILTHLPTGVFYESVSSNLHPLFDIFFRSGGIGVYIFFLLTGFLMGKLYLYPKNTLSFYSRRYLRLFPPFLVMVVSLTIIKFSGNLGVINQILIVISSAIIARIIWQAFLRLNKIRNIGNSLTSLWLSIQGIVAFWYVFYLLKVPAPIFYQTWSHKTQILITGLINATLTLPFGQYIAQLDGVYWTLASEVLFYLLFPLLFIPLFHFLKLVKSIKLKFILFLTLIPFCFGLYLINTRILGFEILKLHLIIYFIFGAIVGTNLDWFRAKIGKYKIFTKPVSLIFILILVFGHILFNPIIPNDYYPLFQIFLVFPTGLLLLTALHEKTISSRFLDNPLLIFFGKYSYSLYLTHSFVIHLGQKLFPSNNLNSAFLVIFFSLGGSVILSWILYHLIEKPYFELRKNKAVLQINTTRFSPIIKKKWAVFTLVIFAMLYIANKEQFSLFTFSLRHETPLLWKIFYLENAIPIRDKPVELRFTGKSNGLGMISTHIRNRGITGVKDVSNQESKLLIRLENEQNEIIAQTSYQVSTIIDSPFHPFGFPIQNDSKGRKYTLYYQLTNPNPAREIELVANEGKFISVYFFDKEQLLRDPLWGLNWIISKICEPLTNPMFWFTIMLITPTLLTISYIIKNAH